MAKKVNKTVKPITEDDVRKAIEKEQKAIISKAAETNKKIFANRKSKIQGVHFVAMVMITNGADVKSDLLIGLLKEVQAEAPDYIHLDKPKGMYPVGVELPKISAVLKPMGIAAVEHYLENHKELGR